MTRSGLPVRARLAGGASVVVGAASRRLGRGGGSVIGGRVGLFLAPDLLGVLAGGRRVALVSGTNGKTTTTRLLAAALGEPVATSGAGANLPPGLTAALAGAPAGAPAVLEVDEAYLGRVSAAVSPEVVVLLNLSRDQLDRVSEVRMVAERWRVALAGIETTVVANADDPLVAWAAGGAAKVIWVAAGLLWRGDAVGCPACDGEIVFSAGGAGEGWSCRCGFGRPHPDVRLVGNVLMTGDGRELTVGLLLPGRANRANAAMAAVAAGVLGVDEAAALGAMGELGEVEGRFARMSHGDVGARLLLAKNPAGWTELLEMLEGGDGPVVVGINARIADGHDPSWLWDVDFERLSGRLVVATGDRRRDLAVRLRYAGVAHMTVAHQLDALGAAGGASVEYVGNYTAFQDLRRLLSGRGDGGDRRQGARATMVGGGGERATGAVVGALAVPQAVFGEAGSREAGSREAGSREAGSREAVSREAVSREAVSREAVSRRGRTAGGPSALRVVVIYPDLLGTYGDGGNGRILAARAAWRSLPVELVLARSDGPLPTGGDLYCIGGGEDGPQIRAAERLADGALAAAVGGGATVLAVCAGYQIMGTSFPGPDGRPHAGLGLLEIETVRGSGRRAVGELVAQPLMDQSLVDEPLVVALERLTGFENHAGVTRLGPSTRPLATVVTGIGNGDGSGTEGARAGRIVGTYLHGPVLARNPTLADMLLALATGTVPEALDDHEERALHRERLQAASRRPRPTGERAASWRRLVRVRGS